MVISRSIRDSNAPPVPKFWYPDTESPEVVFDYWAELKEEMRILICTKDKKYADVRKQIDSVGAKSKTVILTSITAALAPHIGIAEGALVPGCAVLLYAVLRMGRNVLCQKQKLTVKMPKKTQDDFHK
jgi:hypothetical protein